ncbi:MAG: bifunctional phosphoserine phosphatase/homoserine phosphotransferase ThrH [bacterium]
MIACLDLEGVLVPEIWINVAEKTGIAELRLTTRDIPDYDVLMKRRLQILEQHQLKLKDIQDVIATMSPLEGAQDFLHWLQSEFQVIILSDTFYQFAQPLMKQLHFPTLFCHSLRVDKSGKITDYLLRMKDQKRESVKRLKDLNFKVAAAGDSYNDIGMLEAADVGILFCPPEKIVKEYPNFPVTKNYDELKAAFQAAMERFTAEA